MSYHSTSYASVFKSFETIEWYIFVIGATAAGTYVHGYLGQKLDVDSEHDGGGVKFSSHVLEYSDK